MSTWGREASNDGASNDLAELAAAACNAPLSLVVVGGGEGEAHIESTFGSISIGLEDACALAAMLGRRELVILDESSLPPWARSAGARVLAASAATDVVAVVMDVSPRAFTPQEGRRLREIARQIRDRVAAERARDAIVSLSHVLVCSMRADGGFEALNAGAWWNVLGYSEPELERTIWTLVHQDDAPRMRAELNALRNGQTKSAVFETRLCARDGTYRSLAWNANLDRASRRVVAVATDVTALRSADAQRRAQADQLQRSNADLQEFAQVASHDLQEPLRKIVAFGDRLTAIARDKLGEQGLDYLRRMTAAAERMSLLIESLLELSRVTTQPPAFADVDLGALFEAILVDLEERITLSRGDIAVGRLPVIRGDRAQLLRLFQNLVANALKFHAPGVAPVVRVHAQDLPDGRVQVTVADEGVGFDEKYQSRLFKPFQRLHAASEFTGTGMGLAIAAKIAARHGAEIAAHSTRGKGSVFVVRFPAHSPKEIA